MSVQNEETRIEDRECEHPTLKMLAEWYLYLFEKGICSFILFFMIPGYYIYLITVIRQSLIEAYKPSKTAEIFDLILTVFAVVNVAGNMIMSLVANIVDVNANPFPDSKYCNYCKAYRALKSYHCTQCNVCIFDRDHHCTMLSRCVGINNLRYFILYLVYIFFSMIYYTYHLYIYLDEKFKRTTGAEITTYDFLSPLIKFIQLPRAYFLLLLSTTELECLLIYVNVVIILWMIWMIHYHGTNLLRGLRSYEADHDNRSAPALICALRSRRFWKRNIINVFGAKWYIAFFWPFVYSPPENAKCRLSDEKIL